MEGTSFVAIIIPTEHKDASSAVAVVFSHLSYANGLQSQRFTRAAFVGKVGTYTARANDALRVQ